MSNRTWCPIILHCCERNTITSLGLGDIFNSKKEKSNMLQIKWNAASLRNPSLLGNRLPITQTGLDSLARQIKKGRENVFPSDRLGRVPVVGFHYVGTLSDHWRILWNNIRATAGFFFNSKCAGLGFCVCTLFFLAFRICSVVTCVFELLSGWHKAKR